MTALRALLAAIASVALLAASPAAAADPAPSPHALELSKRLFAAMHMERTMAQATQAMAPMMARQMEARSPQLTPAQRQAVLNAASEMTAKMTEQLMARMIPIYAATLTEKELADMLAFYEGPSGQAILEKTPRIMAQLTPAMTEMMPQMMAEMQTRLCKDIPCPGAPKP